MATKQRTKKRITTRPGEKERRAKARVLVSLTAAELELELLRRAIARTAIAIGHAEKALRDLHAKHARQAAEIARLVALIDGRTADAS